MRVKDLIGFINDNNIPGDTELLICPMEGSPEDVVSETYEDVLEYKDKEGYRWRAFPGERQDESWFDPRKVLILWTPPEPAF